MGCSLARGVDDPSVGKLSRLVTRFCDRVDKISESAASCSDKRELLPPRKSLSTRRRTIAFATRQVQDPTDRG
ncbi:hypothetical protein ARZXY2_310 [Arthrobacter sp. ZXY-2]|nr:hypothetical protein ARZXY2_310 [Arthrobacter sp. ZXY-2]